MNYIKHFAKVGFFINLIFGGFTIWQYGFDGFAFILLLIYSLFTLIPLAYYGFRKENNGK